MPHLAATWILRPVCLTFLIGSFLLAPAYGQDSTVALSLPITSAADGIEYNLVLFLYNPPGGTTVVERAAITQGSLNGIGTELQELEQMRGQQFYKRAFRTEKSWARDVDLDGYKDLTLPISLEGASESFAIFLFSPKRSRFEFLSEYSGRSDATTKVAFEHRSTNSQRGMR
jgi:hypothetical protein